MYPAKGNGKVLHEYGGGTKMKEEGKPALFLGGGSIRKSAAMQHIDAPSHGSFGSFFSECDGTGLVTFF